MPEPTSETPNALDDVREPLDPELQDLAAYAAEVIGAPVALVTEFHSDRQTFLAKVGFGRDYTSLEEAFCTHTVLHEDVFEVPDASKDPRFANNPLVTGEARIRFYAGAAVRTGEGLPHNALCVLDTEPRELSDFQRRTLALLARQVGSTLALRSKNAEHEATRARRDRTLERAGVATYDWDVPNDRVYGNARLASLFGIPLEEEGVPSERFFGALHEEDRGRNREAVARALASGGRYEIEYRVVGLDGVERSLLSRGDVTLAPDRTPLRLAGVVLDISDRVEAERSERAVDARYKAIFESVDEGFCLLEMIADNEGRIVDYWFKAFNRAFSAQAGVPADLAARGLSIRQIAPDIEESWIETYGRIARTGVPERFEMGSDVLGRYCEVVAFRLEERPNGDVAVIFKDVTERRESQKRIAEERARQDQTLAAAGIATYDWHAREDRMFGNGLFAEYFGVPNRPEGNPLALYFESIHPDDRERVGGQVEEALRTGERYDMRYRVRDAGGRERHLLARGETDLGEDGRPERLFGIFLDETDRMLAEQAERAGEVRLEETLRLARVATFDWDIANDRVFGNGLMAAYYGFPNRPEGNPIALYYESVHPDDRQSLGATIEASISAVTRYGAQYRLMDAEGRVRWVFAQGETTHNESGAPIRLSGVLIDVTTRVEAELARQESERRLRIALRGGRMGTWDVDLRTGTMECSETCKANYGRGPTEAFSYEDVERSVVEEDRPAWRRTVAQAIETGGDFEMEYRVRWPDASLHWVQVRGTSVADDASAVVGLSGVSFDVTAVKTAHEGEREATRRLAAREELFRTVFEQAPDDAILVMDRERTLTAWNPAAERITGWTAAEAIGKLADLIFVPEDAERGDPAEETENAARAGKAEDERWHMRKDGSRFWGSGTMNALHDVEGTVTGFLKVFRDATERYEEAERERRQAEELERRVEQRTAELRQSVEQAEGFNYSISHDLRTPLRAMASTSGILLEELGPSLDETHRELLERQAHNANRLGRLIDELLRLSRLARVPVNRRELDMTSKANRVWSGLVDQGLGNGCRFEAQEGMAAQGDAELVQTVLHNLIENACKFSPKGGNVRMRLAGDVFSISDEGMGFDMAHAARMWLPFERLVLDSEFEGTGIGLANVKRIVERHGGRVWAESELGKGSTFFFTLGQGGESDKDC